VVKRVIPITAGSLELGEKPIPIMAKSLTLGVKPVPVAAESWNLGHRPVTIPPSPSLVVKLLLDTGKADPDSMDSDGRTPLWWATKYGFEAVVKLLRSSIAA
jgi:ankyrin repeat protein